MGKLTRCTASGHPKICYPTQRAAIRRAIVSSSRRGVALRMYRCPDCGAYHLTKKPKWSTP